MAFLMQLCSAVAIFLLVSASTNSKSNAKSQSAERFVNPENNDKKGNFKLKGKGRNGAKMKVYTPATGQFGNVMFQYASLFGLAMGHKRRPILIMDNEPQRIDFTQMFPDISVEIRNKLPKGITQIKEKRPCVVHQPLLDKYPANQDIEACCFLQSWKYFNSSRSDLRKEFKLNKIMVDQAEMYLVQIRDKYIEQYSDRTQKVIYVGVHIWRTNDTNHKRGWRNASKTYLTSAMNVFRKQYGGRYILLFVVSTNDVDWVAANVMESSDVALAMTKTPVLDLALLTLCNHTIISVGSFGWWAAWLTNGDTIYYKNHVDKKSVLGEFFNDQDYFPPSWIPLGDEQLSNEKLMTVKQRLSHVTSFPERI